MQNQVSKQIHTQIALIAITLCRLHDLIRTIIKSLSIHRENPTSVIQCVSQ
jgi:hypothetical protein